MLPFLPPRSTSSSAEEDRETRQSAVNRIKASRSSSYANVQLPPTPPHDAVAPSLTLAKSQSVPGYLEVPASDTSLHAHRVSPTSCGSSPLSSSDRSSSVESGGSARTLVEDTSSSGSETDYEDANEEFVQYVDRPATPADAPPSPCPQRGARVSFNVPKKQTTARPSTGRSSSYYIPTAHHRKSYQCEQQTTISASNTVPSLPRIRESVSNNFLSRMFGVGGKEKADRGKCIDVEQQIHNNAVRPPLNFTGPGARNASRSVFPPRFSYERGVEVVAI